jgi:hypothetical protein
VARCVALQSVPTTSQVQNAGEQVATRRRSFRGAVLAANGPLSPFEGCVADQRLVCFVAHSNSVVLHTAELAAAFPSRRDSPGGGRVGHRATHGLNGLPNMVVKPPRFKSLAIDP